MEKKAEAESPNPYKIAYENNITELDHWKGKHVELLARVKRLEAALRAIEQRVKQKVIHNGSGYWPQLEAVLRDVKRLAEEAPRGPR